MLSRDALLGRGRAVTLAVETVSCPEIGGDVVVAEMTAADGDAFDAHCAALRAAEKVAAAKDRRPPAETVPLYAERYVLWCLAADETGAKALLARKANGDADGAATEPSVGEFARATPRGVMERLWRAARKANGFRVDAVDEVAAAAKNSDRSRDGGSGSDSPSASGSSAGTT